ncbi:MAG TPA: formate dehydrogenase subunit alpha [Kofleriaceae bacterium]|nr:formate dehydrogenase subunit alpha [Kofleriaceae bacterium]
MARITVDGRPIEVDDGSTILDALGATIPQLCNDARVIPAGACRSCLVHVAGLAKAVPACTTLAVDGMEIATRTPELEAGRREILDMLAERIPELGPCRLADAFAAYGVAPRGAPAVIASRESLPAGTAVERRGSVASVDDSHPYLRVDMAKCIDCFLCERICHELQGQDVWHAVERDGRLRLVADTDVPLGHSSCVACGACADACPTGAIEDRSLLALGRPERFTRTTCPYCGVGCELEVGTRGDRIVQVRPSRDAVVNKGHACVKGRYAFAFVDAPDRITAPMVRGPTGWREATWDEAIAFVAERLTAVRAARGPDAIAILGSARATNEENYLAQKLARVVIGTNNVDCCARVCHAPSAAALAAMFGTGAATGCFDDIELASTIVVVGANSTESHPVIGARIRQAARRHAELVVIDSRRTELAAFADLHLQPRLGTDIPLLHAIAHVIFEEDLLDHAFVGARVTGLDELQRCVEPWSPERASRICGLDAAKIAEAARRIAASGPVLFFHGLGATEHVQGTETVQCIANLALLTGNVGLPGTGVNPLRGQNNVQGAAHMGCEPHRLTGYVPIEAARERFEQTWGAKLPTSDGLDLIEMIDAADRGELAALWAIGYDVLLTNPDANRTRRALGNLDLVIVQDLFMNETARELAHVILPACSSYEKDGTFMNAERRIQRVRAAVTPRGPSRADWQILCAIATAMGHAREFAFASPCEIWDEIRRVWPAGGGITYERLEHAGLQWPCPSEDHPGTQRLHATAFATSATAPLHAAEYQSSREQPDREHPFVLNTGRRLYQFNAGTMTGRTENQQLQPEDVVEISSIDAGRIGIRSGDRVQLVSRYGQAELAAAISDRVREGELFATFHTAAVFLNHLTGPGHDAITNTPEYKRTAVRIQRI